MKSEKSGITYEKRSGGFWYPVPYSHVSDGTYKESGPLVPNINEGQPFYKTCDTLLLFKHLEEASEYMRLMSGFCYIFYLVEVSGAPLHRRPRERPDNEICSYNPIIYDARPATIPPDCYKILDSVRYMDDWLG